MLKIGITGGIGSGKTTICSIFKLLNIPVYNADLMAKKLMTSDENLIESIKILLGNESYTQNGELNRPYIANIIFKNIRKLKKLNFLVHPEVKIDFEKWATEQESKYVIKEAALLFEAGSYKDLDYNILVFAPLEVRISRVINRDNTDRESIISRINNQMPEEEKNKLADYFINNDGNHSLIKQILQLHSEFLSKISL